MGPVGMVLVPSTAVSVSLWVCLGPKESARQHPCRLYSGFYISIHTRGTLHIFPLGVAGQALVAVHGHGGPHRR